MRIASTSHVHGGTVELKTARLTLLIDPNKKAAFESLCARQDKTASQVVRQMIREYLAQHGVTYEPSGPGESPAGKVTAAAARQAGARGRSTGRAAALAPAPATPNRARRKG
jgi:hypothetical protein